jgi:hypothetical protein
MMAPSQRVLTNQTAGGDWRIPPSRLGYASQTTPATLKH